jgi:DNA-directed RNA polymerase II subunit RPB2
MAGSLLSTHFRQLFKSFTEVMQKILKKDIDSGATEIDIKKAMKADIITRGLKNALATGNWGKDKNGDTLKTGVA